MRKVDWTERYQYNVRRQRKALEEYAAHEIEWADDLLTWYRARKQDIPDDEYRAVAFFKNREYLGKPGSLTFLYSMYGRMMQELPESTPEIAFDLVAFRFRMYAAGLRQEGL
ncbi:hypothetical protein TREPR_2051 [Treponema primitia ZAS-2]|uniref:Uncharacterized protein n=1 Tax=Treponema primitia (strain ATCC BAA-887 / DSM 12427 / ZAS-2) TaxID=545694 RepID=F5YJT4_TREPZ|nr:hypothetical protein [Treponema primitia]AEF85273.1 hypothetical protein TREPR_2051 [Treponema primitia ZAS-2]